jgi:hypothetical protein
MRKIARITNPVAAAHRHLANATLVQEFWLRYHFVFFSRADHRARGHRVSSAAPSFAVS